MAEHTGCLGPYKIIEMKLHRSINEAAVPLLMYMEKRADFVKSNTYGTEKNV